VHLVIYTQKNETPYIFKFSPLVPLAAALVLAFFSILLAYFVLKTYHLNSALQAQDFSRERIQEKLSGKGLEIAALEERIRYIRENPTTPELLFEALSRAYAFIPEDTIQFDYRGRGSASAGSDLYAIQIAAHREREQSEILARDYRARIGRRTEVEEIHLPTGRWYRVLILPFASSAEARLFADSLIKQGIIKKYYIQTAPRQPAPADTSGGE
jgi:hypothetical protein